MNVRSIVTPTRLPAPPQRLAAGSVLSSDRTFRVLQTSRTPMQLSLFPTPAQSARGR